MGNMERQGRGGGMRRGRRKQIIILNRQSRYWDGDIWARTSNRQAETWEEHPGRGSSQCKGPHREHAGRLRQSKGPGQPSEGQDSTEEGKLVSHEGPGQGSHGVHCENFSFYASRERTECLHGEVPQCDFCFWRSLFRMDCKGRASDWLCGYCNNPGERGWWRETGRRRQIGIYS